MNRVLDVHIVRVDTVGRYGISGVRVTCTNIGQKAEGGGCHIAEYQRSGRNTLGTNRIKPR